MSLAQQIRPKVGVVISAGKMMKTVKVRVAKQKWNKRIQKYYDEPFNILVSDPTQSVREGDVISCISGLRSSSTVRHVVTGIIAPMGPPLSERPPVPTESQRLAAKEADRAARDIKQAAKGRVVAGRRVAERRRLEEIARQDQRAERALYEAQKLKKEEADLRLRQKAAELIAKHEMLDKDLLQSFTERLSKSLEKQTSGMIVSLAYHLQEAKTSLEQGRRVHDIFQKDLNRLGGEVLIPSVKLMIKEAELKITRLERYMDRIRGQEQQLRDTDARLLEKAQGVTQPEDFALVNIIKELEMTENEKKAARRDLHGTGPTTAAIIKKQKVGTKGKSKEAAQTRTPKDGSTAGPKPPSETKPSEPIKPEVVKEAAEKPEKKRGIFGWFR